MKVLEAILKVLYVLSSPVRLMWWLTKKINPFIFIWLQLIITKCKEAIIDKVSDYCDNASMYELFQLERKLELLRLKK